MLCIAGKLVISSFRITLFCLCIQIYEKSYINLCCLDVSQWDHDTYFCHLMINTLIPFRVTKSTLKSRFRIRFQNGSSSCTTWQKIVFSNWRIVFFVEIKLVHLLLCRMKKVLFIKCMLIIVSQCSNLSKTGELDVTNNEMDILGKTHHYIVL